MRRIFFPTSVFTFTPPIDVSCVQNIRQGCQLFSFSPHCKIWVWVIFDTFLFTAFALLRKEKYFVLLSENYDILPWSKQGWPRLKQDGWLKKFKKKHCEAIALFLEHRNLCKVTIVLKEKKNFFPFFVVSFLSTGARFQSMPAWSEKSLSPARHILQD